MITVRPGSHAHDIITLLSFVGEFPVRSLYLLGNERVIKALVHRMTLLQEYRLPDDAQPRLTCKLLKITGEKSYKTLRLTKAAIPILDWIHPNAREYYLGSFWNHRFPGDSAHRERNHRVAEAAAMFYMANIQARAYDLPPFQNSEISLTVPEYPAYYLAKDLKKLGESEMNKTMFTRVTGVLFSYGEAYAVYNTRSALMKWNGMGEFKTLHSLIEIARLNAGIHKIQSAILFGESEEIALKTLLETEKNRRLEFRFDNIYQFIYFVPMNSFGIRLLRLFAIPNWKAQLNELLFDEDDLSKNQGVMEYDAFVDGKYVYSFLYIVIARLIRLREALQTGTHPFEVLCFPEQFTLLRKYLGPQIDIKTIDIDSVEDAMGR